MRGYSVTCKNDPEISFSICAQSRADAEQSAVDTLTMDMETEPKGTPKEILEVLGYEVKLEY